MDLSYQEKQDRLKARIRAHKMFANVDIEDWIDSFISTMEPREIFDLGCGNGNHLGLYLRHVPANGKVVGMDRERKLIEEAAQRFPEDTRLELHVGSMDERLPFKEGRFDICLSNFAIYNASDPDATLREVKRVMSGSGALVLIGPTKNNAREIYEYNQRLTGQAIDPVTFIRTDRLRLEILPIVEQIFGKVRQEMVNSFLTFPDQDEFLRYYKSTMLFEEGAEKAGYTEHQFRAACAGEHDIVLSKEMLALVAQK